jgi:hypothetical protein
MCHHELCPTARHRVAVTRTQAVLRLEIGLMLLAAMLEMAVQQEMVQE